MLRVSCAMPVFTSPHSVELTLSLGGIDYLRCLCVCLWVYCGSEVYRCVLLCYCMRSCVVRRPSASTANEGTNAGARAWPIADHVTGGNLRQHALSPHPAEGGTMASPIEPFAVESGELPWLGGSSQPTVSAPTQRPSRAQAPPESSTHTSYNSKNPMANGPRTHRPSRILDSLIA